MTDFHKLAFSAYSRERDRFDVAAQAIDLFGTEKSLQVIRGIIATLDRVDGFADGVPPKVLRKATAKMEKILAA